MFDTFGVRNTLVVGYNSLILGLIIFHSILTVDVLGIVLGIQFLECFSIFFSYISIGVCCSSCFDAGSRPPTLNLAEAGLRGSFALCCDLLGPGCIIGDEVVRVTLVFDLSHLLNRHVPSLLEEGVDDIRHISREILKRLPCNVRVALPVHEHLVLICQPARRVSRPHAPDLS